MAWLGRYVMWQRYNEAQRKSAREAMRYAPRTMVATVMVSDEMLRAEGRGLMGDFVKVKKLVGTYRRKVR